MKSINHTRFTIIITAYNIEKYINRAIESALNQEFKDYEILVVDDCSTDDTLKLVDNLNNGRIITFSTGKNTGSAGAARNIGIDNAKGEYIIFLDGDDTLYSTQTLKEIDKIIGEEKPEIVYLGYEDLGQNHKERISTKENSTKEARLTCDLTFSVSSRCWRKAFLTQNNIRFVEGMFYEDELFCLKSTILSNKTICGDIKVFKYYRNRKGSVMSEPSIKKCSDWYRMLAEVVDLYQITPDEYKKYLLSFIKNESDSIPKRIASILHSLEFGGDIKLLPKREYDFRGFFDDEN